MTEEDFGQWLKFYDMDAPLTALGYLVSHDPVSVCTGDTQHRCSYTFDHLSPQLISTYNNRSEVTVVVSARFIVGRSSALSPVGVEPTQR